MYPDVIYIVFIQAALIIEKYFRFSQHMYVSNYLFSPYAKHVWIQVLIILHKMLKYILSESVIDQQYRILNNFFYNE